MPETILDKFPLTEITPLGPVASNAEDRLSRLKRIQQSLIPQKTNPDEDSPDTVIRPGDQYRRYRKVSDVPDKALPFFELAGMLIL